ncbi:MAG: GTP-binding protein [Aureispira sp.]|nr:GTP-binding protein [Aureispira sp.]
MISKKVILTGSFGVGKTSLFRRFIENKFDEKYLTTIGVKVDKKVVEVGDRKLTLIIWDIAGEVKQDKVPTAYFMGTHGLVYVLDLTRPDTYKNIAEDIEYLQKISPKSTIKVVGNKCDLLESEEALEKVLAEIPVPCNFTTSAKTGENVETLFAELSAAMLA